MARYRVRPAWLRRRRTREGDGGLMAEVRERGWTTYLDRLPDGSPRTLIYRGDPEDYGRVRGIGGH